MSGRVIHVGEYDGQHIDDVVEMDPAWILWAVENLKGTGIGPEHIAKARANLDREPTDYEYVSGYEETIEELCPDRYAEDYTPPFSDDY